MSVELALRIQPHQKPGHEPVTHGSLLRKLQHMIRSGRPQRTAAALSDRVEAMSEADRDDGMQYSLGFPTEKVKLNFGTLNVGAFG